MERKLFTCNLDEIASRWQIPVARVKFFITDLDMDPTKPEKWAAAHWDIFISEKQKAFEDSLFPRHLRPEPSKTSA